MQRFLPFLLILSAGPVCAQNIVWVSPCAAMTICLDPGSCTEGTVLAAETAVTNCGNSFVNYSYKIDLGNNGSIDIQSGDDTLNSPLPLGTHLISWRANDNCGKVNSDCSYLVTIKDCNPPNLLCINGLTQTLEFPECTATFDVEDFIINVNDNCTPANQIQIAMREAGSGTGFPTDTSLSFGMCEQGLHVLQIWVKDGSNLVNQCNSYVLVQDNSNACPCNINADLSLQGCAHTPDSIKLDNYTVRVEMNTDTTQNLPVNPTIQKYVTDSCFNATYTGLPLNKPYSGVIRAQRIGDPLAGVSTFDLVLINKHILGQQALENFYQVLAADVNQSKTITTFDIIEIRKLILGIYDTFPAAPAWRFIRPLNDPSNLVGYDLVRDTYQFYVSNLLDDVTLNGFNFVGVKIGDANSNATFAGNAEDRGAATPLLITAPDQDIQAGEAHWIPLQPSETIRLEGWQLALQFDPEAVEITDLRGISIDFATILPEGRLHISVVHNAPAPVSPEEPLAAILVKAKKPVRLSKALRVDASRLAPEVYPAENQAPRPVVFRIGAQVQDVLFFPPQPNPFAGETTIGFFAEQETSLELEIFDLAGRRVYHSTDTRDAGYQAIAIPAAALPAAGVWAYRVRAGKAVASGRLVRL